LASVVFRRKQLNVVLRSYTSSHARWLTHVIRTPWNKRGYTDRRTDGRTDGQDPYCGLSGRPYNKRGYNAGIQLPPSGERERGSDF